MGGVDPLVGNIGNGFWSSGESRGPVISSYGQHKRQGHQWVNAGLNREDHTQLWDVVAVKTHVLEAIGKISLVELEGAMSGVG